MRALLRLLPLGVVVLLPFTGAVVRGHAEEFVLRYDG